VSVLRCHIDAGFLAGALSDNIQPTTVATINAWISLYTNAMGIITDIVSYVVSYQFLRILVSHFGYNKIQKCMKYRNTQPQSYLQDQELSFI